MIVNLVTHYGSDKSVSCYVWPNQSCKRPYPDSSLITVYNSFVNVHDLYKLLPYSCGVATP